MAKTQVKLSTIVCSAKTLEQAASPVAQLTGDDVRRDPTFDEGLTPTTADIDALDAAYLGLTPEGESVALRLGQKKAGSNELQSREERQAELAAAEAAFNQRLQRLAPQRIGAPQYGLSAPRVKITLQPDEDEAPAQTVALNLEALQAATIAYQRQYQALIADLIKLDGERYAAEGLIYELITHYRPLLSAHYGELFYTLLLCAPQVLFYALRFNELRYYYLGEHNYIQSYQLFDKLLAEDRRFNAKIDFYRTQQAEFFARGLRPDDDSATQAHRRNLLAQYAKMDKRTAQARFLREKLKEAGLITAKPQRVRPKRKVRMKTTEDYELITKAQERERLLASGQPLPPELLSDLLSGDLNHPETGTIGVYSHLAAERSKAEQRQHEQESYFSTEDDETHESISLEQKMRAALERHNADVANNFGLGPEADFKSPFFGAGKARYAQDLEQSQLRSLYNYVTHDELVAAQQQGMAPPEVDRPLIIDDNINNTVALMRQLARERSYGPIDARRYHPSGELERRTYRITRPYTFDARRQIEDLAQLLERNEFELRHSLMTLISNTVRLKEIWDDAYKSFDLSVYAEQGWFRLEEQERLCLIVYMGKHVTIRAAGGSADHKVELSASDVWQSFLYLEGLEFKVTAPRDDSARDPNHLSSVMQDYEVQASAEHKRKRRKPNRPNMITPDLIEPCELCYILL